MSNLRKRMFWIQLARGVKDRRRSRPGQEGRVKKTCTIKGPYCQGHTARRCWRCEKPCCEDCGSRRLIGQLALWGPAHVCDLCQIKVDGDGRRVQARYLNRLHRHVAMAPPHNAIAKKMLAAVPRERRHEVVDAINKIAIQLDAPVKAPERVIRRFRVQNEETAEAKENRTAG